MDSVLKRSQVRWEPLCAWSSDIPTDLRGSGGSAIVVHSMNMDTNRGDTGRARLWKDGT